MQLFFKSREMPGLKITDLKARLAEVRIPHIKDHTSKAMF